jgi:metallo-beta-lactamase family protein
MKITFIGATEEVTGSNILVETNGIKFLVDCGMYQGSDEEERKNWEKPPFDINEIDFILITHSHIDHIGRLPYLYRLGYRKKIYSTEPVAAFAKIFLDDTCHLINNTGENLGLPELFNKSDVAGVVGLFETCRYHETISPAGGIEVKFYDAGHILGAGIIEVKAAPTPRSEMSGVGVPTESVGKGETIVFSGDLGNPPVPILNETENIPEADYVVMESTYGSRNHKPASERRERLAQAIEDTAKNKGVLLIPSFAMERTQEILYEIDSIFDEKKVERIPVYIDSPLAIKATEIYQQFVSYYGEKAKREVRAGSDFFNFPGLKMTESTEQSKEIDRSANPKIIIAGSGMSNGGRIQFHERRYLPDPTTTLLIVGFQVNGTLGRRLVEGEKQVKIQGEKVNVMATVDSIDSYSAHADQQRLISWATKIAAVKKLFLVHGEPQSKDDLKAKIEEKSNLKVAIPKAGEEVEI